MTKTFSAGMAEAARLVKMGDLGEATNLIQRVLSEPGAGPAERPGEAEAPSFRGPVIEGEAVPVGPRPDDGRAKARGARGRTSRPRAGLGETLRGLAARHGSGGPRAHGKLFHGPRPAPAPLPEGASFEARTFRDGSGSLDYKLYTPSGRAGERLPLVVMLHGCTQSPDDFAAGTRMNQLAEEQGCLVAYPAQTAAANPQRCWNWFRPEHQERDRGEPGMIAGIVREILREHPADPDRVYVAGLSAGGAAAAVLAAAYPDLIVAVGVHSGLATGAASDVVSAFAAMRRAPAAGARRASAVPTIVFHGDRDGTVHMSNGDEIVAGATAAAGPLRRTEEQGRAAGGQAWTRAIYTDAAGRSLCENWTLHEAGHAWAGGDPSGSYTDPSGPDASREMLRFFLKHRSGDGGAPGQG